MTVLSGAPCSLRRIVKFRGTPSGQRCFKFMRQNLTQRNNIKSDIAQWVLRNRTFFLLSVAISTMLGPLDGALEEKAS